jgi:photosystem II stability/assembly factor-like uncharacterized protein
MKTLLISFSFLSLFLSPSLNAQWYPQYSGVWSNIYSISSVDGQTAWISGTNGIILKTTNSGATWLQKNSGTSATLGYIYFFDENEGIAAGNYGNIRKTTDGGNTWFYVNSGTSNNLNDGSFVNDSLMYLIGWNGTLLVTSDKGDTWQLKTPISSSNYHWVQFWDENLGWASTWFNGQIWKTTDGGNSWSMKLQMGNISLWQVCFVSPLNGFAVGEWGVIIKTGDGGENWTQYFAGTQENLHAVTFINPDVGWIVGKDENRLTTSNGGSTWVLEHSGNDYEYLQVYFLNESIGWILGTSGFWTGNPSIILYTDNGGVPVELTSFTVNVNEEGVVKLNWSTATETNNSGFEVQRLQTNVQNKEWEVAGFVPGHGTTTVPQYYSFIEEKVLSGQYKYRLKQIDYDGTFEYSDEVAFEFTSKFTFTLEQNYPNPFNPSTKIKFSLPANGHTSLKVYDILGREVSTLLNEEFKAGEHEVEFNAENLPSGVYFYRIKAGEFTDIKKMLLLK